MKQEADPSSGQPRTMFLILAWILLFFGVCIVVLSAVLMKRMPGLELGFCLILLAGVTGILLRRWSRRGRLGQMLPSKVHGQDLERKVSRLDVVVAAAVVLGLLILAWLRIVHKGGI